MKSNIGLTLVCLVLASLATAAPTPEEPLFVSRMVRRQAEPASDQRLAAFCGEFALEEPQKLQVRSYNDSATAYLGITPSASGTPELTTSEDAALFDFQTCNTQGFTQGYTRNTGGSMGAPLEYWGRVVANVSETNSTNTQRSVCLTASATPPESTGSFSLASCDDQDPHQWFRLQEAIGSPSVSYFPLKNESGFEYTGQTPAYFAVDLHPQPSAKPVVQYSTADSDQYVIFDD